MRNSKITLRGLTTLITFLLFCVALRPASSQDFSPSHHIVATKASPSYEYLRAVGDQVGSEAVSPQQVYDRGWWQPMVARPIRSDAQPLTLTLDDALISALEYSHQVKVFSDLPLIRETAIVEADAAFDWYKFLDSRWDDTSEPIGNALTAGAGVDRFQDHNLSASAGLRKRTLRGGTLEARQRFGFQDNNSQFFVPDQQGTARLSLNFTQPLMRGRGKQYNLSLKQLACIDKKVADDEFRRQLESHLLEVSRSYWALYLERAVLYQKINSFVRGKEVYDMLDRRRNIDAPASQIVAADATLKQRSSELMRSRAAVKNAEARLRSLVNDPCYGNAEIIPVDTPSFSPICVNLEESIAMAIQCRQEVRQAVKQLRAACIRLNMSKHELLPVLNLVTEAYVSGLQAEGDVIDAWERQFNTGQPSYAVGLQYEMPIGNRAARARHTRRRLEMRQLQNQYQTKLETIRLEVEVAVRELETSQNELSTKQAAMQSRAMQLDSLTQRWERLPGEGATAALTLDHMLVAQDRLAGAEFEYLKAQLTYNLAQVNHKRAIGVLLQHEQVSIGRACICNLPTQILDKSHMAELAEDLPTQWIEQAPVATEEF